MASTAWPQGGVSNVRGVARDQTQAVVPNAAVTLTNSATNITLMTKTNDAGISAHEFDVAPIWVIIH